MDQDVSNWTGGRMPLQDTAAEAARTSAYWAWSGTRQLPPSKAPVTADAEGGGSWVRLMDGADADWEAAHMQHSIGHSWDRYSGLGTIYSLRSEDGLPQATVLVDHEGCVVHAREHENARLSPEHAMALRAIARYMNWTIRPEDHEFDVLREDGAPNTRFRYMLRDSSGHKSCAQFVAAGRLSGAQVAGLSRSLQHGCLFMPGWVGEKELGDDGMMHTLMSVRDVHDEPTSALAAEDVLEALETRGVVPTLAGPRI